MDAEPHPIIMTSRDASVTPPPVCPALKVVAHVADGPGHTIFSCDVVVAPSHGSPVMGTSISSCAASTPVVIDVYPSIYSPHVRSIIDTTIYMIGGSICAIATDDVVVVIDCSKFTVRTSCISSFVCPFAGAVITISGTCPVGVVAAPSPLLLDPGTALADSWRANKRVRLFFGANARGSSVSQCCRIHNDKSIVKSDQNKGTFRGQPTRP